MASFFSYFKPRVFGLSLLVWTILFFFCLLFRPLFLLQADSPDPSGLKSPASPQAEAKLPETAKQPETAKIPIDGYFDIKYRIRWTENSNVFHAAQRDENFYEYLSLNIGDTQKDKVTASLFARASQDLDHKNTKNFYVFDGILDTYRSSWNARLYSAYIDVHQLFILDKIRIGRQFFYDTPETVYFDGVSLETVPFSKLNDLTFGLYGGIPTHFYENSNRDDGIVGAYLTFKPLYSNKVRLDWIHVEDRNFDTNILGSNRINNLFALSFWQTLSPRLQVYTQSTVLEDNIRDLSLRGTYLDTNHDFQTSLYFKTLFKAQRHLSIDFDPYFSILQDYYPYRQYQLDIQKGIVKHLSVAGGVSIRDLVHNSKESRFNHAFRRFYLTPVISDIPFNNTDVSLTGEWWQGSRNQDINTFGFDITHRCTQKFKASIGTYYSLYKYDYFIDTERNHTRSYYLKWQYKFTKKISVDGRYEFERDNFNTYHQVEVSVKVDF